MKKNKIMLTVISVSVIIMVLIGFLVFRTYSYASTAFIDDGYILTEIEENTPQDSVNVQHYFNKGEKFTSKYPSKIVFHNVDGNKVSCDTKNFLHYQSGSMSSLTKSVILDTNMLDREQISYYSVSNKSLLESTGRDYQISNAGELVTFSDFVWKISDTQYMAVSNEIKLQTADNEQKVFEKYVEIQYKDGGVVYLVNQEGTYSTVSSDAYLMLENGMRIYLGSKNISDGQVVLVNMSQMIIDSDDNIEIIPDEEYKKENVDSPTINIDVEDGEEGKDGNDAQPGKQGEDGEAGDPGTPGEMGNNGDNGNNGNNGSNGSTGSSGATGSAGAPGSPGSQGESADDSNIIFTPETMPQFDAALEVSPYGVKADINYDDNSCNVTQAVVSIIEKSSGAEVWRKDVTDILAAKFTVACDVLKQNTEYALVISSTYTNSTNDGPITQDVYKKLFVTDNLGIELEKKYSTQQAIVLNMIKTEDCIIKSVRVKYFDKELNFLGYGTPVGIEYDATYYTFDISQIDPSLYIPVEFNGLVHNETYYMQLEVVSLTDGQDVTIIPTNSFPLQKFMTLKTPPEIGKPSVSLSVKTNSFVIGPSYVLDPDNGIMYYRYEIYEAGDIVMSSASDTYDEGEEDGLQSTSENLSSDSTDSSMVSLENDAPTAEDIINYEKYIEISTDEDGNTIVEKKEDVSFDDSADQSSSEVNSGDDALSISDESSSEVNSGDDALGISDDSSSEVNSGDDALDISDENSSEVNSGDDALGISDENSSEVNSGDDTSDDSQGDSLLQTDENWLANISYEEQISMLESFQSYDSQTMAVLTSLAPIAKGSSATSYEIKAAPVMTIEKETASDIDVAIDGEKIKKNTEYVVRIVGIFYDNEGIIEYSSPLSDVFSAGDSSWPSVVNELSDVKLTASTADGTIIIKDIDKTIDIDKGITIKYSSNTPIGGSVREGTVYVDDTALQAGNATGYYEIPYALKALKSEQSYTISVIAKKMIVNDNVYTDTVVGTETFTTKTYNPILIEEAELEVNESKGHSFVVKIALKPSDFDMEAELRNIASNVDGLIDMGDMSCKSLTYLKFELYSSDEDGTPCDEPFAGSVPAGIAGIQTEGEYSAEDYMFDTGFYKNGYISQDGDNPEEYYIKLSEEDFGLTTEDLIEYTSKKIYVKAVAAYDYTYGRGSGDRLYGDNNIIPIGTETEFSNSNQDSYVEAVIQPVIPAFPDKPYYNQDYEVTKYTALSNLNKDPDYYYYSNAGELSLSDMKDLWENLDENTDVGVTITGPVSLARYSDTVQYFVYNENNELVAQSDKLTVAYDKNNPQLPKWTFFLDIGEEAQIHRGENFTIETKVVLKYVTDDTDNHNLLYPDETDYKGQYISSEFCLDKEIPQFRIIPWEADTQSQNSKQVFYLTYKDIDYALEYRDDGTKAENVIFYKEDSSGKLTELSSILAPLDAINGNAVNNYYSLTCDLSSDEQLAVRYALNNKQTNVKELISQSSIIKNRTVTFKNIEDIEAVVEQENNVLKVKFEFDALAAEDLGRVDVDFSSGDKKVSLKNLKPSFETVSEENPEGETEEYYRATLEISLSDLIAIAGTDKVDFRIKLYYDDGKYGLKYAVESDKQDEDDLYYALQKKSSQNYISQNLADAIYSKGSVTLDTDKNAITLSNFGTINYGETGMEYVPKNLSFIEANGKFELNYVLPDVVTNVVTGFSVARIDAAFSGNNTLVTDSYGRNVFLKYKKKGDADWVEVPFDKIENLLQSSNGQNASILLEKLDADTSYEYEIWGYAYEEDSNYVGKTIYDQGSFKTKAKVEIEIIEDNITFTAGSQYRTDKKVNIPFILKDVFAGDLEEVSGVILEVFNEDNENVSSKTITQSELQSMFAKLGLDSDQRSNLSCTGNLNWEPDENHLMNEAASYTIKATVKYDEDMETNSDIKYVTPTPWDSENTSFTIIGDTGSRREVQDGTRKDIYFVKFTVNGVDVSRLITGSGNDKAVYYVQLFEVSGGKETAVEGSSKGPYTVTVDNLGNIQAQDITFENLNADTNYKIKVYFNADNNNEGLETANGTDEGQYNTVNESNTITTPKSASAYINAMSLIPSESQASIFGGNLGYTDKLQYTLYNQTTGTSTTMTYTADDGELGNVFKMNQTSGSENNYTLYVAGLNDSSCNYLLTVKLYEKNDDGEYIEVASISSTYQSSAISSVLSSLSRTIGEWLN